MYDVPCTRPLLCRKHSELGEFTVNSRPTARLCESHIVLTSVSKLHQVASGSRSYNRRYIQKGAISTPCNHTPATRRRDTAAENFFLIYLKSV